MKNILKLCSGLLILILSCKEIETKTNQKNEIGKKSLEQNKIERNLLKESEDWLKEYENPKSYNALSLLASIKFKEGEDKTFNIFQIVNEFPENWVKFEDIEKLTKLIDSKEKCKYLVNPLSSNIPIGEKATIGGFAVLLIKSFKNKTKIDIGLYYCPETSEKEIVDMKKWWSEYQQK